MQQQTGVTGSRPTGAAALLAVGGLVTAVGPFLSWFKTDEPTGSTDLKGMDLSIGLFVLLVGVLVLVAGVIVWAKSKSGGSKAWSITAIVLAAIGLFAAAYSAAAPEPAFTSFASSDYAEAVGISDTEAELRIEQAIDAGTLEVTSGVGTYVSTVGTLLGLVGGILGVIAKKKSAPAMAYAPQAQPPTPPPAAPPAP